MATKKVEVIPAVPEKERTKKIRRVAAYCRVSTESEEQAESYESQQKYYTQYINENPNYEMAGIYADAISGGRAETRSDFMRMISDAMAGKIDLIITKSISRFARNTLDTLHYVRTLKQAGIEVFFEKEGLYTLGMESELVLTVLASVAQAELENTSKIVSMGLRQKMIRGEMIGYNGCLGYDYNKDTKTMTINESEAEIVRYIFDRYLSGAGCDTIAKELTQSPWKTMRGSDTWGPSAVRDILHNDKYIGELTMGKTFTTDPITKRRIDNIGEREKFVVHNHHEPIISRDVFERVQEIMESRGKNRKRNLVAGERQAKSKQYAFSCMINCGFCGHYLTRRVQNKNMSGEKVVWQCSNNSKHGKNACPHCKAISEEAIEKAFIASYNMICVDNEDLLEDLLHMIEEELENTASSQKISDVNKKLISERKRSSKLLDFYLNGDVSEVDYKEKYADINDRIEKLENELHILEEMSQKEINVKESIVQFRKAINTKEPLQTFDRDIFEAVIDHVVAGEKDGDNIDPYKLTFYYKGTGQKDPQDAQKYKPERKPRKNSKNIATTSEHDMSRR